MGAVKLFQNLASETAHVNRWNKRQKTEHWKKW